MTEQKGEKKESRKDREGVAQEGEGGSAHLDVLPKPGAIVVADCLGVAKRLEDGIEDKASS